jgi:hypothetical protein
MSQISLVLPFALPPPELAPDLVRAMQAPGLAALLSRTSSHQVRTAAADARALPHETWLGSQIGLSGAGGLGFAAAVMRGFGLEPDEGTWFIVNPAHIEITRSHLVMADMRRLGLIESHSRALFDSARPYFEESGKVVVYGDAHTWFMRADRWSGLDTASPDAAAGMNLTDWLPSGERALDYRKLQNEVQMLWHQHPANVEREARGLAPVNSFWPWGAASPASALATDGKPVCADSPPWLAALGRHPTPSLADLLANPGEDPIYYSGALIEAALAGDWANWLAHMQRLEKDTFTPLHDALTRGGAGKVRLVLSHRNALAEFTTTPMAQRKFWRRPTLDRLLP